jgi:hypothetical protein
MLYNIRIQSFVIIFFVLQTATKDNPGGCFSFDLIEKIWQKNVINQDAQANIEIVNDNQEQQKLLNAFRGKL